MQTITWLHLKIFNYLDQISQEKRWISNYRRNDNTLLDELIRLIIDTTFDSYNCDFVNSLGNIEDLLSEPDILFLVDYTNQNRGYLNQKHSIEDKNNKAIMLDYILTYLYSNFDYVKQRINYSMNHFDKVREIHSLAIKLQEKAKDDIEFSDWISSGILFQNNKKRQRFSLAGQKENNNSLFNFAHRCVNNNLSFDEVITRYYYFIGYQKT